MDTTTMQDREQPHRMLVVRSVLPAMAASSDSKAPACGATGF
jgi:hypothetical protein